MGVALKQDGGTIGVFTPKKVLYFYSYKTEFFFLPEHSQKSRSIL